jgi:virginiamycin B lyase
MSAWRRTSLLAAAGALPALRARLVRGAPRARIRVRVLIVLSCALLAAGAGRARAAIFWVNTDSDSIGAANLGAQHASGVRQRLIAGLDLAAGIAAGPGNYIYWSDSGNNRISRAHLYYDRRGRLHVQLTRNFITGADHPAGVAVYGGFLYWVNDDTFGSIGRARLNGSDVDQQFVPSEAATNGQDLNYASGIAVTGDYIYWADSNQDSLARAATATGAGARQFLYGLRHPDGVAVAGRYIYWADDVDNGTIGRAGLDGSSADNSFISGARGPCGVAVAGGYIYWANSGYGATGSTVARAKLDGSGVSERYVTGAFSPCGVAIDTFVFRRGHAR